MLKKVTVVFIPISLIILGGYWYVHHIPPEKNGSRVPEASLVEERQLVDKDQAVVSSFKSAESTTDLTESWQTYTSQELDISFKVSPKYRVLPEVHGSGVVGTSTKIKIVRTGVNTTDPSVVSVFERSMELPRPTTVDEWWSAHQMIVPSVAHFKMAGIPAIALQWNIPDPVGVMVLSHGRNLYAFSIPDGEDEVYRMLATLKFVE